MTLRHLFGDDASRILGDERRVIGNWTTRLKKRRHIADQESKIISLSIVELRLGRIETDRLHDCGNAATGRHSSAVCSCENAGGANVAHMFVAMIKYLATIGIYRGDIADIGTIVTMASRAPIGLPSSVVH
ncbi:hypothetical protein J6500_26960 [Bradyrhizobium sp. WSM 1704]|uniref:hypothetical protein n=1 Tax=Bradyrhizobium semiaridum TaxID=2821404 RepID=UPI001CE3565B|nr:hypothetical protein [Bradyrhizobium semiaridum]MCA6125509.1 hypothetical protein [Bradyrhizobium semiaridum]